MTQFGQAFSPEQILEVRVSEVIETATSTYLSALEHDEQSTAKLYVQKAAQAADEAWQQNWRTAGARRHKPGPSHLSNTQAPPLEMKTATTWTRSALQAQLSRLTGHVSDRLKDTLLSMGAWEQVTRVEDLHHAQVSHACAGSVLTPHDYITNVQKRLGNRVSVGGGQCR